jgi:hypothetical protein
VPVLIEDPVVPEAPQKLVVAEHRPRPFYQRHQHVEGATAEPYRPPSGKSPKRPNSTIAGGVGEANYGRRL